MDLLLKWRVWREHVEPSSVASPGSSARIAKDGQASLVSALLNLLGTWSLQLLRDGQSLRFFLNQHLSKLSENITYGMHPHVTWPITSDIHLTWEIRYERHTKPLIICTIQLWRAYTSNQDDTGHFDHQGCHNQGCKAEVYSWGEGSVISELLGKGLLRELILRGTFLHYRLRPPRNADNGSKEETVSCITTEREISIGKAGQQWINKIKELQCYHLIELVIISGQQPRSG